MDDSKHEATIANFPDAQTNLVENPNTGASRYNEIETEQAAQLLDGALAALEHQISLIADMTASALRCSSAMATNTAELRTFPTISQGLDSSDLASDGPGFSTVLEDEEMTRDLFDTLRSGGHGSDLSAADIDAALAFHGNGGTETHAALCAALRGLRPGPGVPGVGFTAFACAMNELPRVRGPRVRWAGALGLDAELARRLPKGDVFDGLRGLRELAAGDGLGDARVTAICASFCAVVPELVRRGLRRMRDISVGAAGEGAQGEAEGFRNSKFSMEGASEGAFAGLDDFHAGPERLLGAPNPRVEEGMRREHLDRSNAGTRFSRRN